MKKKILKYLKWFFLILLVAAIPATWRYWIVAGENPSGDKLTQLEALPNYKDGKFTNPVYVSFSMDDMPIHDMMMDYYNQPVSVTPSRVIPSVKTDLKQLAADKPVVTWFGHSSYLIKANNYNVLVDPVFSGYAAPFSIFVTAFEGTDVYTVDDLPEIDLLIITHDHYDHLDYETVKALKDKVKKVVVPMGVSSHLLYWDFDPAKIIELNWNDSSVISNDVRITATPAQHMSGRGFTQQKTLWTSYALQLQGTKIFVGGDSGYGEHFKKIGDQYGPFDIAFLENGQYNRNWHEIHMFPEETVKATQDLRASTLFPVHWSKFVLANHPWNESIKRVFTEADRLKVKTTMPKIGEPYVIGSEAKREEWWRFE